MTRLFQRCQNFNLSEFIALIIGLEKKLEEKTKKLEKTHEETKKKLEMTQNELEITKKTLNEHDKKIKNLETNYELLFNQLSIFQMRDIFTFLFLFLWEHLHKLEFIQEFQYGLLF